jgi:hypothetical protein
VRPLQARTDARKSGGSCCRSYPDTTRRPLTLRRRPGRQLGGGGVAGTSVVGLGRQGVEILAFRSITGLDDLGKAGLEGMETAEAVAGVGLDRWAGFSTALTRLSRESTEDWMRSRAAIMAMSIGSAGGFVWAGRGRVLITLSAATVAGTGLGETAIWLAGAWRDAAVVWFASSLHLWSSSIPNCSFWTEDFSMSMSSMLWVRIGVGVRLLSSVSSFTTGRRAGG